MNILTSTPERTFQARLREANSTLESQIDDLRAENDEKIADFDITYDEYFRNDKQLDLADPRVQREKVKGWQTAARALVGGVAGAFVGYQGGYAAGITTGVASAATGLRRSYQHDILDAGDGAGIVMGSGVIGLLSAVGGTFGAVVSGITGAIVASNFPTLFTKDPYGRS